MRLRQQSRSAMLAELMVRSTVSLALCYSWYNAIYVTQLMEVSSQFWIGFIILSLLLVAACTYYGSRFTVELILFMMILTSCLTLIISLLWLCLPLEELLPIPKSQDVIGWSEEPAPGWFEFYSKLAYIFALPIAVFLALLPAKSVKLTATTLVTTIICLAAALQIYSFFFL